MNRNHDECGRAIAEGDKITKGDDVEMIAADPVNFARALSETGKTVV